MPDPLEIHFLDVGTTKYGDSVIVRRGDMRILIDGAHPGDTELLGQQMDEILGGPRPHRFDLLVLTHCHSDHIGCLPDLVARGVIAADRAYLADVDLGWGTHVAGDAPDAIDSRVAGLLAVLREENPLSLKPAELDAAITDALGLRGRLERMVAQLQASGTELIACTGREDRAAIEAPFAEIGLQILGPSREHLLLCATQIAREQRDAVAWLNRVRETDSGASPAELFRGLLERRFGQDGPLLEDGFGEGSALNCQSIVLALQFAGRKVLLAGDMQFADPDVGGIEAEMQALREAVARHGPYDLVKTCHHTSHNGWDGRTDGRLLPRDAMAHLVHSGGVNDPSHPARQTLRDLRELRKERGQRLTFLRTDRNGRISFTIDPDGSIGYAKAKGRINTFQPNVVDESAAKAPAIVAAPVVAPVPVVQAGAAAGGDFVEIITRIPNRKTRLTLTVEVDPALGAATRIHDETGAVSDPGAPFALPADRRLPPLLFVTDEVALGRKIGARAAADALRSIAAGGHAIVNERLAGLGAAEAAGLVRPHLADRIQGVVLLGGADVAPSARLDVLDPELRRRLDDPEADPDNFIVWNDEIFGDRDGDEMPELPVSRIVDGGSAALVAAALGARVSAPQVRFGVRNVRRPFANAVFRTLPGSQVLLVSEPVHSTQIRPRDVQSDIVYFMLHGDDSDARRFWGESSGGPLEAFSVEQVPANFSGVVFSGCCWGGLTTTKRALHFAPGVPVTCRTIDDSIALRFLAAGAQAFVGCTGVHYSPGGNAPTSAGGPMHVAFFQHLVAGEPPARALFNAKRDCLLKIADDGPEETGIALKIIRQFTCLGLGW